MNNNYLEKFLKTYYYNISRYYNSFIVSFYLFYNVHIFTQLFYFKTIYNCKLNYLLDNIDKNDVNIINDFLNSNKKNKIKDMCKVYKVINKYMSNPTISKMTIPKNHKPVSSYTLTFNGCIFSNDAEFKPLDLKASFYLNCFEPKQKDEVNLFLGNKFTIFKGPNDDVYRKLDFDITMRMPHNIFSHILNLEYIKNDIHKFVLIKCYTRTIRALLWGFFTNEAPDLNKYVSVRGRKVTFYTKIIKFTQTGIEKYLNIAAKIIYEVIHETSVINTYLNFSDSVSLKELEEFFINEISDNIRLKIKQK